MNRTLDRDMLFGTLRAVGTADISRDRVAVPCSYTPSRTQHQCSQQLRDGWRRGRRRVHRYRVDYGLSTVGRDRRRSLGHTPADAALGRRITGTVTAPAL